MVEKVTRMMVKVDLQCSRCCKKIKKILCKFPQIGDHVYDYKLNAVFITVVCCSPEKIRDKIICKGGDTVLGVEILPEPPKEQEKNPEKPKEQPKEQEKKPEKPKEPEKPEKPKEPEKKPEKPKEPEKKPEKPKEPEKKPEKPKETPKPAPNPTPDPAPPQKVPSPPAPAPAAPKAPEPAPGYPPMSMYPMMGVCWCPCYEGSGGGPCYCQGQGRQVMCSDGCGRPDYECQGGSRAYCANRCDYFNEENATGCIVM